MTREQLAHVLRAASRIAEDPDVLVIGSQSILGTYAEDELPQAAWMSMEADIAFLSDEEGTKAMSVDGAIGELSNFHQMYAYYSQGVEIEVAVLPEGWRERLVPFRPQAALPAQAWCLEKHDLVISKLAAARHKDMEFSEALLLAGLVDKSTLHKRALALSDHHARQRRWVIDWLDRQP